MDASSASNGLNLPHSLWHLLAIEVLGNSVKPLRHRFHLKSRSNAWDSQHTHTHCPPKRHVETAITADSSTHCWAKRPYSTTSNHSAQQKGQFSSVGGAGDLRQSGCESQLGAPNPGRLASLVVTVVYSVHFQWSAKAPRFGPTAI